MMNSEDSPAKTGVTDLNDDTLVSTGFDKSIKESVLFPSSGATSPSDEIIATPDSSLLASLRGDDDFNLDAKDLVVKVDNPEKHSSTIDSYITFRIITKTSRPEYDNHEYSVRRRYSDFIWLRTRLENEHPSHLIPPLPEKHSLHRLSRFTVSFLKTRMFALNKFLQRVADHPVLSFNENFKVFLTVEAWEFTAHRKQGPSLISRVTDSFHNMAATYLMKDRSSEFEDMNIYMTKLSDKIGVLERIAQRVQKEQQEYVTELDEFHSVLSLWSASEAKLQKGIMAMANAIAKCSVAQKEVVEDSEVNLCGSLREYCLYAESIKDVLKRRDAMQIEYELTVDELNKRKTERDQLKETDSTGYSVSSLLGKNSEEARQDKKDKLDHAIEELIGQVEINNDKVEIANEDLKADMERWQTTKEKDIKTVYTSLASKQIEYYQKCLSFWEEAMNDVKNCDQTENQDFHHERNDVK